MRLVAAVGDQLTWIVTTWADHLRNHERVGLAREQLRLERDSLFLSANHQVVVR